MQLLELNPLQKAIKDSVLTAPNPDLFKNLPYHTYFDSFRSFDLALPRRIGKTTLIIDIATTMIEQGKKPMIMVLNSGITRDYPEYLHKYIKSSSTYAYMSFLCDALLLDEIEGKDVKVGSNNRHEFFRLRLYTPR